MSYVFVKSCEMKRVYNSFVLFVLARRAIIHSMRVRLQEYLLICLSVLMSDHGFIRSCLG